MQLRTKLTCRKWFKIKQRKRGSKGKKFWKSKPLPRKRERRVEKTTQMKTLKKKALNMLNN